MKASIALLVSVGVATAIAITAGNYHVVNGATWLGPTFLPKVSFSLSEVFVNFDAVGQMPMIMVRSEYPLFLLAMERQQDREALAAALARSSAPARATVRYRITESDLFRVRQGMTKAEVNEILGALGERTVQDPDSRPGTVVETFEYLNADGSRVEIRYHNDVVERTNFIR
jgi:hypothetical protein